jgi:hypothetical protein
MHYLNWIWRRIIFLQKLIEEKDEEPSEEIGQIKAPSLSKPLPFSSIFFKPHDVRAVTSAMNDIALYEGLPPMKTPRISRRKRKN